MLSIHTSPPPAPRPPQVVIHEHSDALRSIVQQALQAEGFDAGLSLDKAAHVQPALRAQMPDVLLLDLDAPDADGLELCRGVRQAHPRLGLVAMSTRAATELTARCLEAGADHLLCKPVSIVELCAHIRRLHVRAGSWSSGPETPTNPIQPGRPLNC